LLPSGEALAQGHEQWASLERELERTEEIIKRAADLARGATNLQVADLVQRAMETQLGARKAFRNGLFKLAVTQTGVARQLAERAIALLQQPDERSERVEHELEQTDEMLRRAAEQVRPGTPETVHTLLEAGHRQQDQAWELFRAGSVRPALRMTLQVREMLRKLAAQMHRLDPGELQRLLQKTEDLVARALEAAHSAERARMIRMAEQAQDLLMSGQQHAQEGYLVRARRQLMQAGSVAERVLRAAADLPSQSEFETAARQYESQAMRLEKRLRMHPDPPAQQLLDESREHYRLALEFSNRGEDRLWQAMAELRLAMRLLNQARDR
jgi:hypothetical protein